MHLQSSLCVRGPTSCGRSYSGVDIHSLDVRETGRRLHGFIRRFVLSYSHLVYCSDQLRMFGAILGVLSVGYIQNISPTISWSKYTGQRRWECYVIVLGNHLDLERHDSAALLPDRHRTDTCGEW